MFGILEKYRKPLYFSNSNWLIIEEKALGMFMKKCLGSIEMLDTGINKG